MPTQYPGLRVSGPHADIAHINIAHGNTGHGDTAHTNTPHLDGNGPVPHGNTPHADSAHVNTPHSNRSHYDATHSNVAHTDTAHQNAPHVDGIVNFTTFDEEDSSEYLTVTATRITWTELVRSALAYIYKDYDAGGLGINSAFKIEFTLNMSDVEEI